MPVNVHIPIRVRLDADSIEREDDVNEAVQAAVQRALDNSYRHVLAPRDHYLGVQLRTPAIAWSGTGLEAATAEQRERVGAIVTEAIEQASRASKVAAHVRQRVKASTPLMERAAERLDASRLHPLGYYTVPAYDAAGKQTTLPIASDSLVPEGRVITQWPAKQPGWFERLPDQTKIDVLRELLAEHGVDLSFGNGVYGVLWSQPSNYRFPVGLWLVTRDLKTGEFHTGLFPFTKLVKTPTGAKLDTQHGLPERGLITAEWWTADMVRADHRAWLEAQIGSLQRPEQMTTDEFVQINRQFIEHEVDEVMVAGGPDCLVIAAPGSTMYVTGLPSNATRWTGVAYVAPIATEALDFTEVDTSKAPGGSGAPGELQVGEGNEGGKGKDGAQSRKGGYVYGGDEGKEGTFAFPRPKKAIGVELSCKSFGGEPALEQLPQDAAAELRALIADIADRLAIEPCRFAGNFCVTAAWVLGERARTVSEFAAETSTGFLDAPKHKRTPGALDFTPTVTPAIQYLRHLADCVPRITHLARRIDAIYRTNARNISGFRAENHIGWMLDFGSQLNEALVNSVKDHFIHTTRTVFLQLLHTSHVNIRQRLDDKNFPGYAGFFEQLVRSELLQQDELQKLYSKLAAETQSAGTRAATYVLDTWRNVPHTWHEARQQLMDLFETGDPFPVALGGGQSGELVYTSGKPTRIRDSKGHIWTLEQLERAIALRSDTAKHIDPVMAQIMADAKLKARFVNQPHRIREELRDLLEEMKSANENVTQRAGDDPHYAFGLAPLHSQYELAVIPVGSPAPQATVPGTGFILEGTHRVAHETVAEFFRGDVYYAMGVGLAMRTEDTRRWLKEAVEFVVPIVLFVICEPLGVIVGAAIALENRAEAAEKIEAFRGLIDPEIVFEYADLEAELFAADIGVLLSFIPIPSMGKTAAKIGGRAGLKLLQGEVRAAGGILARSVHRVLTKAMLKAIRGNLIKAFIKQIVMTELMGIALNKMMAPVIHQMQRQQMSFEELVALASEVQQG